MTRRTGAIAAGLTVLAVLVTALALTRPPAHRATGPAPGWRTVTVDDALVPAADRVADIALVPPAPHAPGVGAGRLVRPGSAGELTVWQVQHDGRWSGAQLGVPGPVVSVVAAGSDDLVAVAGSTWQDGTSGSYLITSADRASWHRVSLPPEADRVELGTAAVVGDVVYAVGEVRGTQDGRLLVVRGDQVTVHNLPSTAGTDRLTVVGVAAEGSRVLVGLQTRTGDHWSSAILGSDDGGLTWSDPQPLDPDPAASASALVRALDGWLIVGSVPSPTDPTAWVPAAWSSSDGKVWAREQVDPPAGGWPAGASQWFGSLATRASTAVAAVSTTSSTYTSVYGRADGRWSLVTTSDPFTDVAPSAQVALTPDGDSWVLRQGDRSSGVWEHTTGRSGWTLVDSPASTDPVFETTAGLGPGELSASRPMIETDDAGWRTWRAPARFVLDGSRLSRTDLPSPLLDKASTVAAMIW